MYRYEDYNLEQLLNDPGLDPDEDPEVLYAIAQCCRRGKGIEPNVGIAQKTLERAAQAGSRLAAEELAVEEPAVVPAFRRNYASMGLGELARLAEGNDLGACKALYDKCLKMGDAGEAKRYLDRCVELAGEGAQPLELRRSAFVSAGMYYQDRAPEKSRYYLEQAKELESPDACRLLLDYYSQGVGGPVDGDLAESCIRLLRRKGSAEDLYQCALRCLEEGKLLQASILLDEAVERPCCTPELKRRVQEKQRELGQAQEEEEAL